MNNGNGSNGHGGDSRIDLLEERLVSLMDTVFVQQVDLETLRVLSVLQQAEIDNLRERLDQLEGA